jgi:uncharacterized protein
MSELPLVNSDVNLDVTPDVTLDGSPAEHSSAGSTADRPDYEALVRFLILPFLEDPSTLKIDSEFSEARARVSVRVAFEGEDKGRVFGRGGRNIQAIRTVLEGVAQAASHSAYLEVFGGGADGVRPIGNREIVKRPVGRPEGLPEGRSGSAKPVLKLRPKAADAI